jgi:hypothetical protein
VTPPLSRLGSDLGPGAPEIVQVCVMTRSSQPTTGRRRQHPARGSRPARFRISWPCSGDFRTSLFRRNRRSPMTPRPWAHRTERCVVGSKVLLFGSTGGRDAGASGTAPRPPCPQRRCLRLSSGSPRPWPRCSSRTTGASMTPRSGPPARPHRVRTPGVRDLQDAVVLRQHDQGEGDEQ